MITISTILTCELAKQWAEEVGQQLDFDMMLQFASNQGHRKPCELAKQWAEESGQSLYFGQCEYRTSRETIELARQWGLISQETYEYVIKPRTSASGQPLN